MGPKKIQKCTNLEQLKNDNGFSLQRDIHCIGGNVQALAICKPLTELMDSVHRESWSE